MDNSNREAMIDGALMPSQGRDSLRTCALLRLENRVPDACSPASSSTTRLLRTIRSSSLWALSMVRVPQLIKPNMSSDEHVWDRDCIEDLRLTRI